MRVMGSNHITASHAPLHRLHLMRSRGVDSDARHRGDKDHRSRPSRGEAGELDGSKVKLGYLAARVGALEDFFLGDLSVDSMDLMVLAEASGSIRR